MANSLRAKISKLRHDGNISDVEYQELIKKLDGHDKQIRADAIDEVSRAMYHQCFECNNDENMQKWDSGNWFKYKLFENVMEQLKENNNEYSNMDNSNS